MDLSKTGATENSEDASSDSEVAQFYRPGLCHFVVLTDLVHITVVLYVLVFLSGIELARTMAQTQSTMVLDGIC